MGGYIGIMEEKMDTTLGFRVLALGFWVSGLGFGDVWGLGFRL